MLAKKQISETDDCIFRGLKKSKKEKNSLHRIERHGLNDLMNMFLMKKNIFINGCVHTKYPL
ncbi:hypothetical protein ATN88_16990 [Enterovibrio coralii]|uniref:Uncharacterized protein n=1 Tax=Enterovibrio coralii TaxID=294935 RepID=A0A135IDM3_9GAMM|nr:hypothetical protein ATN88_16990 [Enterovibrio coralii]